MVPSLNKRMENSDSTRDFANSVVFHKFSEWPLSAEHKLRNFIENVVACSCSIIATVLLSIKGLGGTTNLTFLLWSSSFYALACFIIFKDSIDQTSKSTLWYAAGYFSGLVVFGMHGAWTRESNMEEYFWTGNTTYPNGTIKKIGGSYFKPRTC